LDADGNPINEEYKELMVQSHALKLKNDMNQFTEVKLMSVPLETLKKQIQNFKEMITFKEDRGP
jgi:hypothetical protein